MNYQEWKKWWEDFAPTYFTDKCWTFSRKDLIEKLNITKESFVLEIGFGYGRETLNFCRLSDHVHGLELTKIACENASQEVAKQLPSFAILPYLQWYNGKDIPFDGNIFDVIYSCFVIQHVSRDHGKELIKEALRVLKPGGKVLFEFFGDPSFYNGGADVFSSNDERGPMYNNAFVENELENVVVECGGKLNWVVPQRIDKDWSNFWVCFGK